MGHHKNNVQTHPEHERSHEQQGHGAAIRWVEHRLWGKIQLTVNFSLSVLQGHFLSEAVRHALFHEFPALVEVVVHADPCECDETIVYHPTAHHHFLPAADSWPRQKTK